MSHYISKLYALDPRCTSKWDVSGINYRSDLNVKIRSLHGKITRLQKRLKLNTYFCIHFRKVSKVLISFCRKMYISWEIYFRVPRYEFWTWCSWIRASQYNSQRKSNKIKQCIKNFVTYLYEAQHVSGDTSPIIRSLILKQPSTYAKAEAASAVLGSWWWEMCRPKHVELHINM